MKKIIIGADHRGYELKQAIIHRLTEYDWVDCGAFSKDRSDYPNFAAEVCQKIHNGEAKLGILICGTGIGMSIAANRYRGIYAALCTTPDIARKAREDDNANVLVLSAQHTTIESVGSIVRAWLDAQFKEGRYRERLALIDVLAQR